MIRFILLLAILNLTLGCKAQNFKKAYRKVYSFYENAENVSYEINYISRGKSTIVDKTAMLVEIIDKVIYTKKDNIQSFTFDSTSVIIDNENKQIQLNVGVAQIKPSIQNLDVINQLVELSIKESYKKSVKGKKYTLYFNNQDFKEISMVLDPTTDKFKKMTFLLSEPIYNSDVKNEEAVESFEIEFNDFKQNIKSFSEPLEQFLRFTGERFVPQQKYSTYQFVSNYDLY